MHKQAWALHVSAAEYLDWLVGIVKHSLNVLIGIFGIEPMNTSLRNVVEYRKRGYTCHSIDSLLQKVQISDSSSRLLIKQRAFGSKVLNKV